MIGDQNQAKTKQPNDSCVISSTSTKLHIFFRHFHPAVYYNSHQMGYRKQQCQCQECVITKMHSNLSILNCIHFIGFCTAKPVSIKLTRSTEWFKTYSTKSKRLFIYCIVRQPNRIQPRSIQFLFKVDLLRATNEWNTNNGSPPE